MPIRKGDRMSSFLNYLISGISLGSIYAIIALGYTMVYGIAKMLNFAHGDIIMVGAYISYVIFSRLSMSAGVAVLAAMAGCMVLGVLIERIAYRPLRGAASLSVLITAIGVSYFLQNAALLIFGADSKTYASLISLPSLRLMDGEVIISGTTIVSIVVTIVVMVGLTLFINRTKTGRAMQAVSEDSGAATLMGIDTDRTIAITFAIGSALAGVAGVLLCSAYPVLSSQTGAMPGIKAFTAAVFGGIGSVPGAMIGGMVMGIVENLSKAYISSQLSDAIVFALLIIILLVKPTGLLGRRLQEKV